MYVLMFVRIHIHIYQMMGERNTILENSAENGTSISIHLCISMCIWILTGIFPKAFQICCEKTVTEQLYADHYNL